MPRRPPRACAVPGCPALVEGGARCPDHARAVAREVDSLRGSAARRGYGHRWRQIRFAFLRRNPLCAACLREGRSVAAVDVDHVVPRSRGGTDAESNLAALCHRCHSSKTAREDGRFGRRLR